MLEALVMFLIYVIVIVIVAAVVLWAVGYFFPEVGKPARMIVGGLAVIGILIALLQVIQGGLPKLGA